MSKKKCVSEILSPHLESTKQENYPLTPFQDKCIDRFCKTIQLDEQAYMNQHPEVTAMLELFISKMVTTSNRKDKINAASKFFTRPTEELDQEIRNYLHIPDNVPYNAGQDTFGFMEQNLEVDINEIESKLFSLPPMTFPTTTSSTVTTLSSSFVSLNTSKTTLPTPEPIPTPELTTSQIFYNIVSNTVDKAVYLHVNEAKLLYDTAYVEILNAVENAMEIAVTEIKEDIYELIYTACKNCENVIMEKERIAAQIAWEKRMRKKMKRTLRRVNKFKGYQSTDLAGSDTDSEDIKSPPPKPCVCHPQYHYNRYPKDRFGIYLPGQEKSRDENITTTPIYSMENILEAGKSTGTN